MRNPTEASGLFQHLNNNNNNKDPPKEKTQPGNPPKQLVCFIGVLGKGRKTILKAPSVSRLCTLALRERFLQLPLGCSHLRVWLPK